MFDEHHWSGGFENLLSSNTLNISQVCDVRSTRHLRTQTPNNLDGDI